MDESYLMYSDAMYWDPYDKVYMAFQLIGDEKRQTTDGTEYESRLRIARADVASETLDYYYEQDGWFGRSGALAYKDNGSSGSNVYLGGSSDPFHISDSDGKRWDPSITLLTESG